MAFTLTLVAGLRSCRLRLCPSLLEAKKRLGRLLERKGPRSICPVIWLVVCSLSEVICCCKCVFNFSAVGKDVVLELFLRVCPVLSLCSKILAPSPSFTTSASLITALCLRLACHLQWTPTAARTTATITAAVTKMVMDEASSAMLWETPGEVEGFRSGSEKWNGRVSGCTGDLVGLGLDRCWILHRISRWNGPIKSN